MAAEPDRDRAAGRQRVYPGILDGVVLAGEGDVRLGPQRLHDLDLLLRPAATVAEILIEADKLDRVPADPDPETESSAAQHVERGGLLGDQHRLALRQDQQRLLDVTGRRAAPRPQTGADRHHRVDGDAGTYLVGGCALPALQNGRGA